MCYVVVLLMAPKEDRKDPAWAFSARVSETNKMAIRCLFCDKITNGGIYRQKAHLIGGDPNVASCPKVPGHVKEELKAYLQKKKELKTQMIHEQELYNLDDDDDETEEGDDASSLPPKSQKRGRMLPPMSSSCGSTGKTKGPMDCYFPQKSGDKGGKSGNPQVDAKAILRDRAVTFLRGGCDAGLPFNCVNYTDTFAAFIEAVGQYGLGMKPPTYYEVSGPYLKKEVAEVSKIVEEHKVEWNKFGCSIMMDKWTARNEKMIINILVNSPKGSLFLESVDASDSSTDSTKMYSLFKSTIDSIGAENIVQVVTDNASENVKDGDMMSACYPHIYWTPCAAHSVNLIFGDIFKERPFSTVFNQAIRVHSYIVQRPLLLNMMKRFTKQRSLVKPAKTRFATAFLNLARMYEQKSNLKKLFVSDEYTSNAYGREARGRKSADIILSPSFWNNVVHALKIGGPLVKVLRLVDGERRPPMGYLYEAIDRAKEAIQTSFSDQRKYKRVFEIIDKRWDSKLHSPLHAAGLVLNPKLFYDNEERILGDEPLWNGYYECIEKLIPEESVQDKITEQFSIYRNAEQLFGKNMVIRQRKTKSPGARVLICCFI
ncbi:hypothetical protein A4A49_18386 [Nicotiana attenuata]|uniref:DUF659 domain-containing protein n=1 Tax=Nicotiana attenuata TaxID=49451 RepID=A0A1J6JJ42_NICAT|nr:hypothetical protein A4A49_18386 [Nicotiana attenuata]